MTKMRFSGIVMPLILSMILPSIICAQYFTSDSSGLHKTMDSILNPYETPEIESAPQQDGPPENPAAADNEREAARIYEEFLRQEIRFQRANEVRIMNKVLERCCQDTLAFYLSMLKDSTFYGHYGDYDQPKTWYIAVESLGQMGKPAIPGLIEKLDSPDTFERKQALMAFRLAIQAPNVTAFCGRDNPWTEQEENEGMTDEEQISAAKVWFEKYRDIWQQD